MYISKVKDVLRKSTLIFEYFLSIKKKLNMLFLPQIMNPHKIWRLVDTLNVGFYIFFYPFLKIEDF